ncbi:MAG: nucleotidyltransferase [Candidatus Caldatribacteriota bacterium]|nr:nucleotidyltransferase [Candidatus Caldatribacteriota bacterium]
MKTLAIISEYNPFHNGHLYQFSKSKEITNTDCILVVMSGNFVQRGEPAIINKWARANMALASGADLVIEMPFVFSTQDANGFALGGVRLINALNVVQYLCFGCENNNRNTLSAIGRFLSNENANFKTLLRENSKKGFEYPKARAQALCDYHEKFGIDKLKMTSNLQLMEILSSPNNILAIEYIKHLLKIKSSILPLPIKRIGAAYHEETIQKSISSATSIRNEILRNIKYPYQIDEKSAGKIKSVMPFSAYNILYKELSEGRAPVSLNRYEQYILATLRNIPKEKLSHIHGINEGLENRIKNAALKSTDIDTLLSSIKTRRYTLTKIKRILLHVMTGLLKEDVALFNNNGAMYIRVIGFSHKGKSLLKIIKKKSSLPIITKLSNFLREVNSKKSLNYKDLLKMIDYDILSTDLYNLGYSKVSARVARTDFTSKLINRND